MTKVVVIGSGIGGLGLAALLGQAGYDVSLYEQHPGPGGRASRLESDGFTFDTGPSWYLMPGVFSHFYDLLGERIENHLNLDKLNPAYKVFYESQSPVTITGDIEKDSETFEAMEEGAGKNLRQYVAEAEKIYNLSLDNFLYTNFDKYSKLVKPEVIKNSPKMITMSLSTMHRHVSKYFKNPKLQQIMEYSSVFLGNSPFKSPALFSLMSALDFSEGVYYPKGGIYKIIESLEELCIKREVKIHYNSPVVKINTENGRTTGVSLKNGEFIKADIVVSNADLYFTETKLLSDDARSYDNSYWDKKTPSPSAILMYMGLNKKAPQLEHHNLLFVDAWQANFENIFSSKKLPDKASMYICAPSKTDPTVAPKGKENIFVLVPVPAGMKLSQKQHDKAVAHYTKHISQITGVNLDENIAVKIIKNPSYFSEQFNAWEQTMLGPSHLLRQSAMFRTPNKSKRLNNLYYVGAGTTPGIGLPMCLISAELVYKRIAGKRDGEKLEPLMTSGSISL